MVVTMGLEDVAREVVAQGDVAPAVAATVAATERVAVMDAGAAACVASSAATLMYRVPGTCTGLMMAKD
jgi:hypothetical protein